MSILPVDTENKLVLGAAASVTENILPLLPDTLNIVEPLPISCNAVVFDDADITVPPITDNPLPETNRLPVIIAEPENGKPTPPPLPPFKAKDAVVAYDAVPNNDPVILPVTIRLPDILTFLDESITNISVLPVDTENKLVLGAAASVTENILPALPDTLSIVEPLPISCNAIAFDPETNTLPVMIADPENGNPDPAPAFKANDAVAAKDALIALDALVANDAVPNNDPVILPVTIRLPDILTFLDESTVNILMLPVDTENRFVLGSVASVTENILPALPDTLSIVEPLPISCNAVLFDPEINRLPVIIAEPENGNPDPALAFKAKEAVVANEAVPIILPVTIKLPDILTFLNVSTVSMSVLPVDTENRFVLGAVASVTENILPVLPDTLSIVEPLPISCNAVLFNDADITVLPVTDNPLPEINKLPVITAEPENGNPKPALVLRAKDAVVANDALIALDALVANEAVPIILPVTIKLPDTFTFLSESITNISVLPVDTENRFVLGAVASVTENILPLLPDTLSIVELLPISCNTVAFDDADIIVLPVTDSKLKLAVSV
jgi:hypothetical protein